jgi:hypothetical protein
MITLAQLKKFFLYVLVGSLIISAVTGVIIVLIGDFNEISAKVLYTLLMVVVHSIISLSFIWKNSKKNPEDTLGFFHNVLFFLIVLSFITSIFGIWRIIDGDNVWKYYRVYIVLAISSLHANILSKALHKENLMDKIIYANFVFVALVAVLSFPVIFIHDSIIVLGEFYYRLWAAVGIIDATLSILAMIFYKLYLHKNQTAGAVPNGVVSAQTSMPTSSVASSIASTKQNLSKSKQ